MFFINIFINIFGVFTLVWNALKASTRAVMVRVGLGSIVEEAPAQDLADVEKVPALERDAIPEEERVGVFHRARLAVCNFFITLFERAKRSTTKRLAEVPLPTDGPVLPQDTNDLIVQSFQHRLMLTIAAFFGALKAHIAKAFTAIGKGVVMVLYPVWALATLVTAAVKSTVLFAVSRVFKATSDVASIASSVSDWATHRPASESQAQEFRLVFGTPRASWTKALCRRDTVLNINGIRGDLPIATIHTSPVIDIAPVPLAKIRRAVNKEHRQEQLRQARERKSALVPITCPLPSMIAGDKRVVFAAEPEVRLYCPLTPESRHVSLSTNDDLSLAIAARPTSDDDIVLVDRITGAPVDDTIAQAPAKPDVHTTVVATENIVPAKVEEVIVVAQAEEPTVETPVETIVEPTLEPTVEPTVVESSVEPIVEPVVEPTVEAIVKPTVEVNDVQSSQEILADVTKASVIEPAEPQVPVTETKPDLVPEVAGVNKDQDVPEEGLSDEPDLSLLQAELDDGAGSASFQAELQQHPILQNIIRSCSSSKLLHLASTDTSKATTPAAQVNAEVQQSSSSGSVSTAAINSTGSLNKLSSGVDSKRSSLADSPADLVASASAAVFNISEKARDRLLENGAATKVLKNVMELSQPVCVSASPAVQDLATLATKPTAAELKRKAKTNRGYNVFGPLKGDKRPVGAEDDSRFGLGISSPYAEFFPGVTVKLPPGCAPTDSSPELSPPALVPSPENNTAPSTSPETVITPPSTISPDAIISPTTATSPDSVVPLAAIVTSPPEAPPSKVEPVASTITETSASTSASNLNNTSNNQGAESSRAAAEESGPSAYSMDSYPTRDHPEIIEVSHSESRIVSIRRKAPAPPARRRANSGIEYLRLPAILKARERKELAQAQAEAAKVKARFEADVTKYFGVVEEKKPARRDLKLPSMVAARDASFAATLRFSCVSNVSTTHHNASNIDVDDSRDGRYYGISPADIKRAKIEELIDALGLCDIQPCTAGPRDVWVAGIRTEANEGIIAAPSSPDVSFVPSFEGVEVSMVSSVRDRRLSVEEVLLGAMGLDDSFVSPGNEGASPWDSIYVLDPTEQELVEHYSMADEEEEDDERVEWFFGS